ncbi:uncharacterized protein PHALS_06330 [Plasmopara halstedii]|uniref:Uncharacterized protein n=1 Tax=Plasmopara halstedii TaxID=4781 RepID=A0A0P1B3Q4_PLAHL|nr:uncharacterized protein PHALS_06330 [Plasmopara halstedii]CEG48511.1 hypothetical protein PHALS_06330 [Plasmopara halstedii]|eukprot:XP_024584880.1 hypothetical protein PHALS_06330 [Plasmopara halstedii]
MSIGKAAQIPSLKNLMGIHCYTSARLPWRIWRSNWDLTLLYNTAAVVSASLTQTKFLPKSSEDTHFLSCIKTSKRIACAFSATRSEQLTTGSILYSDAFGLKKVVANFAKRRDVTASTGYKLARSIMFV